MIIVCPACGRRYRIDRSRMAAGMRLRCSGCRQVFDSRPSAPAARIPAARIPVAQDSAGRAATPAVPQNPPRSSSPPADGRPLVLIGDVDRPFRTAAIKILESLGCQVETSGQGEAVFRATVSRRPALLMLNTVLPGLSGTAVCEGVKGSPHLKSIKVVLVGSTAHPPAAGQATRQGFEPDDQFEDAIGERDLQDRLAKLLGGAIGGPVRRPSEPLPMRAAPRPPSTARMANTAPPAATSAAPAREPGLPAEAVALESTPPVEKPEPFRRPPAKAIDPRDALDPAAEIQRLARIMLSDLKLYNPERFASAVRDGRLLEIFRGDLLRGKDLVTSRFPDLPDRMSLLTAALRRGIEEERSASETV